MKSFLIFIILLTWSHSSFGCLFPPCGYTLRSLICETDDAFEYNQEDFSVDRENLNQEIVPSELNGWFTFLEKDQFNSIHVITPSLIDKAEIISCRLKDFLKKSGLTDLEPTDITCKFFDSDEVIYQTTSDDFYHCEPSIPMM